MPAPRDVKVMDKLLKADTQVALVSIGALTIRVVRVVVWFDSPNARVFCPAGIQD